MSTPPFEKCSVIGCRELGTHVLAYSNVVDDPHLLPGDPAVVREPVCQEDGISLTNTNRVKRAGGVLAVNGAAVQLAPPRIRVRVQFDDEPDANKIEDWLDADAAAIRAGRKMPYVVEALDGAGRVLADCANLIAAPGFEGVYQCPDEVPEKWLAYYAADIWTPAFGFVPGDLAVIADENLVVVDFQQVDQEYGDTGYNTGYLICQSTRNSADRFLVWVEELAKVKEITA